MATVSHVELEMASVRRVRKWLAYVCGLVFVLVHIDGAACLISVVQLMGWKS